MRPNAHPWLPSVLCLLLLITTGTVSAASCETELSQRCLLRHIAQQAEALASAGHPISPATQQQLAYEQESLFQRRTAPDNALTNLWQEDQYLANPLSGQRNDSPLAPDHPFQDTLAPTPATLSIEHLMLSVNDQQANDTKRLIIERTLQHQRSPSAALIDVAHFEVLGGAPTQGMSTLEQAQIDGFSDASLYANWHSVQQLGSVANNIFLNPALAKKGCEEDTQSALQSIENYYSTTHQALLQTLWSQPSRAQNWKNHISLTRLYHNAGYCALFINLHRQQLIQQAMQSSAKNEAEVLELTLLARAIRRYL